MIRSPVAVPFPICVMCGDRIGVYEPCIVVEHDGERQTSIARELRWERQAGLLRHKECTPHDGPKLTTEFPR